MTTKLDLGISHTGIREELIFDDSENQVIVKREADVQDIIDDNKRRQNDGTNGYNPSRTMKHVAEIPYAMVSHWNQIYKDELGGKSIMHGDNWPILKRLLNDADNKFLRTGLGRI